MSQPEASPLSVGLSPIPLKNSASTGDGEGGFGPPPVAGLRKASAFSFADQIYTRIFVYKNFKLIIITATCLLICNVHLRINFT